jgi:cysteine synthase A
MPDRTKTLLPSVVEAIGDTPLVALTRLPVAFEGRILAKLEYLNPGFSKKDRIAREMIEEAQVEGWLRPGQTVVELTSGNTGTGLAIVCAVQGHPFVAVMSRGNSPERARMMIALGAEVVLVDQAPGSSPGQVSGADLARVEETAERLTRERGAFRADQFALEGNFRAHHLRTGAEVLAQSPYPLELFCDFVGTGGSFAGCAAALKAANPDAKCFVVEPASAAVLAGLPVSNPNHRIQGGGYSRAQLKFLQAEYIDGYVQVTDEEAVAHARMLARYEGIFAGFSTGANLAATLKLLQGHYAGRTALILANDSGLKYLSTDLWPNPFAE